MARKKVVHYDLPAPMCRDIGRLMVRFAYVENYLQSIVYLLVGCDQGIGGLAIRDPSRLLNFSRLGNHART